MLRKIILAVILIPLAILIVALAVANREIVTISFDPFSKTEEPIKDRNTREFLAIHWVVTAQVRGIQPLSAGQTLQNINQPREGALDRYRAMSPNDQQRYRRQYEEILRIKARLERPAQKPQMGDFPGPEPPMARADTAVG